MIYVFYGDDSFSANEALQRLYEAVGPQDLWASNVNEVEGVPFDVGRLAAAAQAMPFLASRRLVIVRGLLRANEPQRQAARRGRRSQAAGSSGPPAPGLREALEALPPTTDVAFVDGRLAAANPLLKELAPLASVQEFPNLRRDALGRWVRDRIVQKGGTATNEAVAELVDLVGSNLWAMDTELEKLATYCQGRPADAEDVRALVTSAREVNVFGLVDAIMEQRPEVALRLVEHLLHVGAGASYLLTMIARQARLVALAQSLAKDRAPAAEWGPRLGISQEFVLRKTVEQSRRFSADQVRALYQLLVEADLAMKRGDMPADVAMVELVTRATTMGSRARSR